MPPSSASQRKAAERARKRAEGLKAYEVWVRPEHWAAVKRFIERLVKRRKA